MQLIVPFLISLLVISLHSNEFVFAEQILSIEMYHLLAKYTFQHCVSSERCSKVFEQTQYQNETIFEYFFRPFVVSKAKDVISLCFDLLDEDEEVICNRIYETTRENNRDVPFLFTHIVLTRVWLTELVMYKTEQQVCDINHHLVVDNSTLRGQCECNFDSLCENSTSDKNISIAILIIIMILMVLIFFQYIYKMIQLAAVTKAFFRNVPVGQRQSLASNPRDLEGQTSRRILTTTGGSGGISEQKFRVLYVRQILKVLIESI